MQVTFKLFGVYVKRPHLKHRERSQSQLIWSLPAAFEYRHCTYQLTTVVRTILFTYQSIIFPVLPHLTLIHLISILYVEYALKSTCSCSQRQPFVFVSLFCHDNLKG